MQFIGIPGLSNVNSMREFVAETNVGGIPHIPDVNTDLWSRFEVTRQRTYVLLNDDGTSRQTGYGSLRSDVEQLIRE